MVTASIPVRAHSTDPEIRLRLEPEFLSAAQALDPVNWSISAAEAASEAPSTPATGVTTAPAQPSIRPASAQSPEQFRLWENLSRIDWRPYPARWYGLAGLEYMATRAGNNANAHNLIESLSLSARSFIWQPWFVQLRGNVVFFLSQERNPSAELAGLQSSSGAFSMNASGIAELFPTSRFPWTAQFDTIDSRASGVYTRSDYRNTRLGLLHSWRSPLGDQSYQASVNASHFSRQAGSDTVVAAAGGYLRRLSEGILDAQAFASHAVRDERTNDVVRTSARFSYRPGTTLTAENLFSMYFSREDRASSETQNRLVQLSSFATWRPEEDSPLFVTGIARLANSASGAGSADAGATTAGVGANASYRLADWASLTAAAFVDAGSSEGQRNVTSSQSVGAVLTSPSIAVAGMHYSGSSNLTATNQTGGMLGGNQNAEVAASHQVTRMFRLNDKVSVSGSIGQSAGTRHDRLIGNSRNVAHTGALFGTVQSETAGQMVLAINLGDSRSSGVYQNRFRLANLQLSGQLQITGNAQLSSSLSIQRTEQADTKGAPRQDSTRKAGAVSFIHSRVFNVRGLRYTASAQFNDMQVESRLAGDVDAPRDEIQRLIEQRLDYQIGLLTLRLGSRHALVNGLADHQVYVRVNRAFGNN